jgi:hypothetical protein
MESSGKLCLTLKFFCVGFCCGFLCGILEGESREECGGMQKTKLQRIEETVGFFGGILMNSARKSQGF